MARLKLALEVDLEAFQRTVDRHLVAEFHAAMVEGLNAAGEAGVRAVRKGMAMLFDSATPFTLDGVYFHWTTARTDSGSAKCSGKRMCLCWAFIDVGFTMMPSPQGAPASIEDDHPLLDKLAAFSPLPYGDRCLPEQVAAHPVAVPAGRT